VGKEESVQLLCGVLINVSTAHGNISITHVLFM